MTKATTAKEPGIGRTDAAIPADRLERDVSQVVDELHSGGVAIVPLDVA